MNKTYPYTIDNGTASSSPLPDGRRDRQASGWELKVAQPGTGPPMHVHYLQEEAVQVVRGRVGYQVPGGEPQFAGPGESVARPAGTPHKWWNAGANEVQMIGWCTPPGNIEFFLSTCSRRRKRTEANGPDSSTPHSSSRVIERNSRCSRLRS